MPISLAGRLPAYDETAIIEPMGKEGKTEEVNGLHLPERKRRKWPFIVIGIISLCLGALVYNYARPLSSPTLNVTLTPEVAQPAPVISWPAEGTAAISADEYNFVAHTGNLDQSFSAASMIKILAVLCILEKKSLAAGETGPLLTMTAADVAMYEHEVARDGNHLKIVDGEQMSQYHALEAVLIESANNITDTMAIWAFGSLDNYKAYALNYMKQHGMTHTELGSDASGMDPNTTSTLGDMVALARLGFSNPIITKIIATPSATFTNGGTIYNRNKLLGNGILLGGKTGSLDDIKGSYLFSATTKTITGADTHMVGAIAYDSSVQQAIRDSEALAKSAAGCFEATTLAHAGDTVGTVTSAWGASSPVTTAKDLTVKRWCNSTIKLSFATDPIDGTSTGKAGLLTAKVDGSTYDTPLVVEQRLSPPDILWRMSRKPW